MSPNQNDPSDDNFVIDVSDKIHDRPRAIPYSIYECTSNATGGFEEATPEESYNMGLQYNETT